MKTKTPTPTLAELTTINGWAKLEASEQTTLTDETLAIATALHSISQTRISIGQHLKTVRQILEPKRIFTKYLKAIFHMSKATAYRYIDLTDAAESVFPAPVLEVAMMRPDDRLTIKAIREAPKPPRTTNVIKINEYLDSIQQRKATPEKEDKNPEDVKKAMYHSAHLLLARIRGKQKQAVLFDVFGMLLTDIGISTEARISPQAIPESFRAKRGRPTRKVA